ncbi:MAG: hypothetical protein Ct9H300mP16_17430 [Pseudomonadota bacterium]|nr:MAG: hypothetical protein Ct9H300mP16_17430 [Pseudomonadota bacterium]
MDTPGGCWLPSQNCYTVADMVLFHAKLIRSAPLSEATPMPLRVSLCRKRITITHLEGAVDLETVNYLATVQLLSSN